MKHASEDKSKRLRKAIRITILLAALLAIPFSAMIYLRASRGDSLRDFGEVTPFVVKDRAGNYFDHTRLTNHVTVIALFPPGCAEEKNTACAEMTAAASNAEKWLVDQLAAEPDKPKAPVKMIALAPQGYRPAGTWQVFDTNSFGPGQLTPGDPSTAPHGFFAIDPARHFRGIFPLDTSGQMDWDQFHASMSRMTMHLYFNDYLSKRTFFGPVKAKPTPSPP